MRHFVEPAHAAEQLKDTPHFGFGDAENAGNIAHPRRPEFLLTLPHVHRTSGFFVARLARD